MSEGGREGGREGRKWSIHIRMKVIKGDMEKERKAELRNEERAEMREREGERERERERERSPSWQVVASLGPARIALLCSMKMGCL